MRNLFAGGAVDQSGSRSGRRGRTAAVRAGVLALLWVAIAGTAPLDLTAGSIAVALATVALATWASLALMPPSGLHMTPVATLGYGLRLFGQSILAGIDVARRALDPRPLPAAGFVLHPTCLPAGSVRSAFCTTVCLVPGTLPAGTDSQGRLVVHCLDVAQPVAEQLASEEARFRRTFGGGGDV